MDQHLPVIAPQGLTYRSHGEKLYEEIVSSLDRHCEARIDLGGVKHFSLVALDESLGRVIREFGKEFLQIENDTNRIMRYL